MNRNYVDYRKVQRVELDGHSFRSKAEMQMYLYLKSLAQAGEIASKIGHEVKVTLLDGPRNMRIDYYADFAVQDLKLGEMVWIEVKGFETDTWKMKLKLWRHFGPGLLRLYRVDWNRLVLDEEVIPKTPLKNDSIKPKSWLQLPLPQSEES